VSRRRGVPPAIGRDRLKLEVYCTRDGKHGEDRIARVIVTKQPELELTPLHVRVEYIGAHDQDDEIRESWGLRGSGVDMWRTHTFRCRACGLDIPAQEGRLAQLVLGLNALGKRRVELLNLRAEP
jgi:hypothetical protein